MMKLWLRNRMLFMFTLLAVTLISAPANTAPSTPTTYSGQATVVQATVLGVNTTLVETGPLPPEGGALEESLLTVRVPRLLTANVLHASTIGTGNQTNSEASVADLRLTVGGNTIGAAFLMAQANASCRRGSPQLSGQSSIASLTVNGTTIAVTGQPNQTIPLPNGSIVINEQDSSVSGNFGEITVNALHIIVTGIADVIIASAHADITCGQAPPPPDCFSGAGWITGTPTGAVGTFGVFGSTKNGATFGRLEYLDHGPGGPRVRATGPVNYVIVNAKTRRIEGEATINGQPGTYAVTVTDNGPSGATDTFALTLSTGYTASGTLGGGNITIMVPP